jgi:hypothetical protein
MGSSYPLINGFCQDAWHIGVDRDWRECKDRQLWVEIGIYNDKYIYRKNAQY